MLDDGSELPFDLFLGVPKHRAPDVVVASGMAEDGWIPVELAHARDAVPGRLRGRRRARPSACPKAGVFAEGAARVVAAALIAKPRGGGERRAPTTGRGSCYIEFGARQVGRVDVDFFSGPKPTGTFQAPSAALVAEKEHFGSSRKERWFGG